MKAIKLIQASNSGCFSFSEALIDGSLFGEKIIMLQSKLLFFSSRFLYVTFKLVAFFGKNFLFCWNDSANECLVSWRSVRQ